MRNRSSHFSAISHGYRYRLASHIDNESSVQLGIRDGYE